MIKIILFVLLAISGVGQSFAYDYIYQENVWDLGGITGPAYTDFNVLDFTVFEDNSDVLLDFVVQDCDNTNDVFLYINGVTGSVPCESANNEPIINRGLFEGMDAGTYEVLFGFGNGDYNYLRVSNVEALVFENSNDTTGGTGSGTVDSGDNEINITVENDNVGILGDINDYFNDDFTIRDLLVFEIGLYLFLLVSIFLFKVCKLFLKYFKKLRKKGSGIR